jgi:hypothetical protein
MAKEGAAEKDNATLNHPCTYARHFQGVPMSRKLTLALCLAISAPAAVAVTHAQSAQAQTASTRLLRFAGVLTDAAGAPLAGPQTVTFTIFDEADGGTALWTETLPVSADERGRYAAHLGSTAALPQEVFRAEQARWVGTSVQGREMPRAALVSVPYALKAADADTLGGKAASSFITTGKDGKLQRADGTLFESPAVDGTGVAGQITKWTSSTTLGSSVISESATNRVGFGLTDPTGGGVVDSVFTIKNYDNNTGFSILNDVQQRRFAINTLFSGGWLIYDGGAGSWTPGIGQFSGRVGIGNAAPQADLHVKSVAAPATLRLDGPVNSGAGPRIRWSEATVDANYAGVGFEAAYEPVDNKLIFRGYDGPGILADNVLVMQRSSGLVGVGILEPLDRLHVAGDIRVGTGTTGCVKDADGTVLTGTCSSDFRFKKNITPFTATLGKLSQLQPVHFDWRADEFPDKHFGAARSFGLIAQDVEAILPELVVTDESGFKAVKYSELPLHMLQAIKELKGENDALKLQLSAQEERLRKLEALARK